MRAHEKLARAAAMLGSRHIESPDRESEAIITKVLGIDRVHLISDNPPLSASQAEEIDRCISRRLAGEPLQYILGFVDFFGLRISVGPGVLIPRPETELLVEEALRIIREREATRNGIPPNVLDLCTGSGCIALAIAADVPFARVVATDASAVALCYARANARHNALDRVQFLQGDLFEPLGGMRFDLIVSNPPYIRSADIPWLQKEIRDWEPLMALDGGPDGLAWYRRIVTHLSKFLRPGGRCLLEIGYDQKEDISRLAGSHHFVSRFRKDIAGLDRITVLSAPD